MPQVKVSDRVKIVKAPADQPELLNKTGTVVMLTDGTNAFVQLDDGNSAVVAIEQLQKTA